MKSQKRRQIGDEFGVLSLRLLGKGAIAPRLDLSRFLLVLAFSHPNALRLPYQALHSTAMLDVTYQPFIAHSELCYRPRGKSRNDSPCHDSSTLAYLSSMSHG